jgi:predicted lipid-binding transport protein (Tim44 family)
MRDQDKHARPAVYAGLLGGLLGGIGACVLHTSIVVGVVVGFVVMAALVLHEPNGSGPSRR